MTTPRSNRRPLCPALTVAALCLAGLCQSAAPTAAAPQSQTQALLTLPPNVPHTPPIVPEHRLPSSPDRPQQPPGRQYRPSHPDPFLPNPSTLHRPKPKKRSGKYPNVRPRRTVPPRHR